MKKLLLSVIAGILFIPASFSQLNIAVGKPVKVDSENPSYPAWKAVEGLNYSNANRWVSDNLGYPHWIEVDLQGFYNVEKIIYYVGEYGTNHPVYNYSFQYWDGNSWENIIERTGNNNPEITEEFDPVNTSRIRFYANSGEGGALMLYEIEIYASFNQPPTINKVPEQDDVYFNEGSQSINLEGISDGDDGTQSLTITATSSNTAVVADPVVLYNQGENTAVLNWTPGGIEGSTTIKIDVTDDGGTDAGGTDAVSMEFDLSLRDPAKNYSPTIDPVTNVYAFSNSGDYRVNLKNISDGDTNKEQELVMSVSLTDNSGIIEDIQVEPDFLSGKAVLTFKTTNVPGSDIVNILVKDDGGISNDGCDSTRISFTVVSTEPANAVNLNVDISKQYQVMEGFGGFGYEKVSWARDPFYTPEFIDDIIDDLGVTILRISVGTFIELENENDDPYDLDMDVIRSNYQAKGHNSFFPYLKDVNKKYPVKVIASCWTPPAWMKTNNSEVEGGNLKPEFYQEFAEFIIAYIKLMKEETGIDLYAVSLQNEPTFREPYESCQYTPRTYCDLIGVVGKRFEDEGIKTKLFFPEEVFVRDYDIYPWMETLNSDTVARKYVDIMALHGYDGSGVSAGSIGNDLWENYRNELADHPAHPKQIWMTETSGQPNTLEGALRMGAGMSNAIKHGKLNAWVFWTLSGEVSDPENPEHVYNLMFIGHKLKKYFVSKQYYRYVRPGAVSVEIESDDVDILTNAFIHKEDSTLTYVIINRSTTNKIIYFEDLKIDPDAELYRTSAMENCDPVPLAGTSGIMIPAKSIITIYQSTKGIYLPPTMDPVSDTTIYTSSGRVLMIPIAGISDGTGGDNSTLSFEVTSSNPGVIEDSTVTFDASGGTAELYLVRKEDQTGESTINVNLSREQSAPGDTLNRFKEISFKVSVIDYINIPPTFYIEGRNTIYLGLGQQEIPITDISGGNEGIDEILDFSFTNENNSVFSVNEIDYTQGESNATVLVTPKQAGTERIVIKLTDDGENTIGSNNYSKEVLIRVEEGTNDIPTLDGSGVRVYPVPADSELIIENTSTYRRLVLYDTRGAVIINREIYNGKTVLKTGILEEGNYYLELTGDIPESKQTIQIVVVHD